LKILFYSPHALADSSSGAARSVSNMLQQLAALGHRCMAVTGSVVDAPNELFANVLATPHADSRKIAELGVFVPIRKFRMGGVEHIVVCFGGSAMNDVKAVEESVLFNQFRESFAAFQPDVLLTYGGFLSSAYARLYARSRGCKTILYAGIPSYATPEQFADFDGIVAVSQALARQLRAVTTLPVEVLPPFIDTQAVKASERTPEFITFINPSPAKGLMLAAALVTACAQRGRPYKFMFVESRATRETMLKLCPELKGLKTFFIAQNTADIRLVYARTAILLLPSVWFEAAGQVVIEANANGIPILANDVGGISEMLNGAGYLFAPAPASQRDWEAPATPEDVERWLEVLDRLHNDPAELANAEARARAADARYRPDANAQRFLEFVATL
jgi:glycosyltransferase involved in cell wall biosynthesis